MQNKTVLPRQDKDGNYYISYSALNSWAAIKGFNTKRLGKEEFIRSYFFGEDYPDAFGFAQFGSEVEDYICGKPEAQELFTKEEKATLDTIKPLGVFQHEIKINFDGFYLKGFIDDVSPDYKLIRDYKTASENSKAKYYEDDYNQLDIYALAIQQDFGHIPQMEVAVIERLGNGFRGGRNVMTVGNQTWYIPRTTTPQKLLELRQFIINTTKEISEHYQIFLKLNK
jgi:PD-(D/E)XK nuclease superfamily